MRDPHVRSCGRGEWATTSPMPITRRWKEARSQELTGKLWKLCGPFHGLEGGMKSQNLHAIVIGGGIAGPHLRSYSRRPANFDDLRSSSSPQGCRWWIHDRSERHERT